MADPTNLIVAIGVSSLCMFVYAPVILFYLVKFHRMSGLMVIKKRYPKEVTVLCIVIILYYLLTIPIAAITQTDLFFNDSLNDEIFKRIMHTVTPMFNILIYCMLAHRCFHIVYDANFFKAELNSEWKQHLNHKTIASNRWLRYRTTAGNVVYTRKFMWIIALLLMIPTIITFQVCMGNPIFIVVTNSITSVYFVLGVASIIIFYVNTPCPGSDTFFIRVEFRLLAITVSMHMLLYFTFLAIGIISNESGVDLLRYIGDLGLLLSNATAYFCIAMVTVYYIRWKVYCEIHFFNETVEERSKAHSQSHSQNNNEKPTETESEAQKNSVRKSRVSRTSRVHHIDVGFLLGEFGAASPPSAGTAHSPNMYTQPVTPGSKIDGLEIPSFQSIQLHGASINDMEQQLGGDPNKKIKLYHLMTNKQTFEILMQHLANEYSQELMLCLIEIIQWKRTFFGIYMQINHGQMLSTGQCHYACVLADIVPWTCISIRNFFKDQGKTFLQMQSNEELVVAAKKAAHEIHVKYVQVGSELEINIADSLRRRLHALCGDLQTLLNTEIDIMELFSVYDPVVEELYSLANHSFVRLKSKPDWSRIVYILSKNPLVEPQRDKHAK